MSCTKCGQQRTDVNAVFCPGCGNAFEAAPAPAPVTPPAYIAQPQAQTQAPADLGALLVSGYGVRSNATMMWALYYGAAIALSLILAFTMGVRTVNLGWLGSVTVTNGWLGFWLFIAAVEVALGAITIISTRKTQIHVYERGIVGTGLSKWFWLGDLRTFQFNLYHRDANVAGPKQQIIVTAPSMHYTVYAENANEIRQIAY